MRYASARSLVNCDQVVGAFIIVIIISVSMYITAIFLSMRAMVKPLSDDLQDGSGWSINVQAGLF